MGRGEQAQTYPAGRDRQTRRSHFEDVWKGRRGASGGPELFSVRQTELEESRRPMSVSPNRKKRKVHSGSVSTVRGIGVYSGKEESCTQHEEELFRARGNRSNYVEEENEAEEVGRGKGTGKVRVFPHHSPSAQQQPNLPTGLRYMIFTLAKRLLQQPNLKHFVLHCSPLYSSSGPSDSAGGRRVWRDFSEWIKATGTIGAPACTYTEAVRLIALLLRDVGPGACVPAELLGLVEECVARAGRSFFGPHNEQCKRLPLVHVGTSASQKNERTVQESLHEQIHVAIRKVEQVQWKLWRQAAECTSSMRGQICCQIIDRLLSAQQMQAAVWEGSSTIAAWRLAGSDCVAAAALVVAKVLLSLQLSFERELRSRRRAHGSEEEEFGDEDEADDGENEEEGDSRHVSGRRAFCQDEAAKLWRKMLAKVPRELRTEVGSVLFWCIQKKKMPPPVLVQLFVSFNWHKDLAPCQGTISGLCRIFPSVPLFASLQLHILHRMRQDQLKATRAAGRLGEARSASEGSARMDWCSNHLLALAAQLVEAAPSEMRRSRRALARASRRFVQLHCGSEEALRLLRKVWSGLRKRDQLVCLVLALELRPGSKSTWWRLADFLLAEASLRRVREMKRKVAPLARSTGHNEEAVTRRRRLELIERFVVRFLDPDSCSTDAVPDCSKAALLLCAPFFLSSLRAFLNLIVLLSSTFLRNRVQLLSDAARLVKGSLKACSVYESLSGCRRNEAVSEDASDSAETPNAGPPNARPDSEPCGSGTVSKGLAGLTTCHSVALSVQPTTRTPKDNSKLAVPVERNTHLADTDVFGETLKKFLRAEEVSREGAVKIHGWLNAFTLAVSCFFHVRLKDVFRREALVQFIVESLMA